MKKLLLVAALGVATSSTAFAQSAFEGFFGQVGIGYESTSSKFSDGTFVEDSGPQAGQTLSYSVDFPSNSGFTGAVAVGYYFPVSKQFLLGVGGEFSPLASSSSNYTFSVDGVPEFEGKGKKKSSYNIFVSPAYVIDKDKLAYAKFGYTVAKMELNDNEETSSKNFSGYSVGLGYKQIISKGLFGFAEANYTMFNSENVSDNSDTTGTIKPKGMNFLVGVGYKF